MRTGPSFQVYYLKIGETAREILDKEDPKYLLNVDFHEYLNHLIDKCAWMQLEWHEEAMTIEQVSFKSQRYDRFTEKRYTTDEPKFRLRIPLSPHPQRDDFFRFQPSTFYLTGEPEWRFEGNTLVVDVEASEGAVERAKEDVRFWIGGRNKDIEAGNGTLEQVLQQVWEGRRKQLEAKYDAAEVVLQKLNIPLHQDANSPARPVEIKPRTLRTVVGRPEIKRGQPEPELHRDDVRALVDFIDQYARQFETAPKTYAAMSEEGLRDILVGMMNANYPGSTTSETFNKLGKTDIRLRVDSGNVLICECKFWSGKKAYAEALDQLFGYLTWRQNYGVLIHFCTRKDMTKVVGDARQAVTEHATAIVDTIKVVAPSRFTSRHKHPQDGDKSIEIHHIFVDLSV